MPNVSVSDYYSLKETVEGIEEFREYRGEVHLANDSYDHAIGGNIVPAGDYMQGYQGSIAPYTDAGVPSDEVVMAESEKVEPREVIVPRAVDPLVDPYESPMLDGFLQSDFEPEPVVSHYTEKGKPVYAKV